MYHHTKWSSLMKLVISCMIVFASILFHGCKKALDIEPVPSKTPAQTETPVHLVTYTHTESGISFDYPEHWVVQTDKYKGHDVTLVHTPNNNVFLQIITMDCPAGTQMFDMLPTEQVLPNAKILGDQLINGLLYDFIIKNEPSISCRQVNEKTFISYDLNAMEKETDELYDLSFIVGVYGGKTYLYIKIIKVEGTSMVERSQLEDILNSVFFEVISPSPKQTASTNFKEYSNSILGFKLKHPEDWFVHEQTTPDGSPTVIVSSPDGKLLFYINIVHDTTDIKPYDQCSDTEMVEAVTEDGPAMITGIKTVFNISGNPTCSVMELNSRKYIASSFEASFIQNGQSATITSLSGFYYKNYYLFCTVNCDDTNGESTNILNTLMSSFELYQPQ